MPGYDFKFWAEAGWAALITALIFALTAIVDSASVTDWKAWVIAVGGGAVRAAAGAFLARLTRPTLPT